MLQQQQNKKKFDSNENLCFVKLLSNDVYKK